MISINGKDLSLEDLAGFLQDAPPTVSIADEARVAIQRARSTVEEILRTDRVVYGINTGFGKLANTRIATENLEALQRNLILSHSIGVGPPLDDAVARLCLLLRANALCRGHSGVRPEVVETLIGLLNADALPVIPSQGSVGASGDLAPLSHMALLLIGEGEATCKGRPLTGREALGIAGLKPLVLQAKEGLALINGTQVSCAIGAAALIRARRLANLADLACSMSLEALKGSLRPFDARVAALRPHPGHAETAEHMRRLMQDSEIVIAHQDCDKVQDPYSLRCVPQVHGAARDALRHTEDVVRREINAVTDNPLIFPDDCDVISAGNFHAEPLAIPFDYAAMAVAELASISERRLENMVNPDLSELPAFLVENSGLNSGFMIAQVTAAALVSENKCLCHPASVDSIPTSANKEDHVSMAPIAARQFAAVVENSYNVIAIEFLGALQGLRLGNPEGLKAGRGPQAAFELLSQTVAPLKSDRILKHDLLAVRKLMEDGSLMRVVKAALDRN
ncbi:MAG: histidine ammonia-lyase [Planctomycetota bacterium]